MSRQVVPHIPGSVLSKEFYCRRPDIVARDLLGKLLVRDIDGERLSGIIVEVEAYFGSEDPASRARKGGDLRRTLYGECGLALVYGIHTHWMLNVVAHEDGAGGAVLFRAIEPVEGMEHMVRFRGLGSLSNAKLLTSGPGRLTRALRVDKSFHKTPMYVRKTNGLWVEDVGLRVSDDDVMRDFRVGVTEDLDEPFRFYLTSSKFVSVRRVRRA